jgi:hypothetical protein
MGLVSAAVSAIKRRVFSQSIDVPSRVERNKTSSAADAPRATTQVRHANVMQIQNTNVVVVTSHRLHLTTQQHDSNVSAPVNEHLEMNSSETVDSPVESTTKEDAIVLESSSRTPNKTMGEDPLVTSKDFPISDISADKDVMPIGEHAKWGKVEVEDATASPTKETRRLGIQGRSNFTDEEQERLFKAVENARPNNVNPDWEAVKQVFDATAPPGAPCRSTRALRTKFDESCSILVPLEIYAAEERDRLLKAVEDVAPKTNVDWVMVKRIFEVAAPGAQCRSIVSLKSQFTRITSVQDVPCASPNPMKTVESILKEERPTSADSPIATEKGPVQDAELTTGEDAARAKGGGDLAEVGDPAKARASPTVEKRPAEGVGRPIEEESHVRKRTIQEVAEEGKRPKRKKKSRHDGKQYTDEETERLMEAVAKVQPRPHCGPTWEQVKQHFDENAPSNLPPNASNRTAIALQAKFSKVAMSMMIDALGGTAVNINTSGAETLTTENNASTVYNGPVDNNAIGDAPVYTGPDGEEPAYYHESVRGEPRKVSMEILREEITGIANSNSAALSSDSDNNKASDTPSDDDTACHEDNRLSDAMITFFDRFNPNDGMIVGTECCDEILSRLDTIERNMKTVNIKLEMILSCVQSEEALERAKQWVL